MLARAILVLLIVLNAGAAAWWIAHGPAPAAVEAAPPPGVARLQLVSERQGQPAPAVAPATDPTPAAASPATATLAAAAQCFSLGPFANRAAAESALARVQPLVQTAAVRTPVTQPSNRGWRVFLPAFATLQEAETIAARITAAGFDDLVVVRDGAEARSVALGRYRNEEGARNRAQALTTAGFAPRVEPLDAQADGPVWLEVRADAAVSPARAQAVAGAAQQRELDCAAVR